MEYGFLKLAHQSLALISISAFTLRWYGSMTGSRLVKHTFVRIAPHVIDTLFLATGLLMICQLGQTPVSRVWLGAKISGLVLYIVLGMLAMRTAPDGRRSFPAFIAALLVFGWIVSVALSKSPWGFLRFVWEGVW